MPSPNDERPRSSSPYELFRPKPSEAEIMPSKRIAEYEKEAEKRSQKLTMKVPANFFKTDEKDRTGMLNRDLDLSDSFLLSSTNSITVARKAVNSDPIPEEFKSSSIVLRFFEMDQFATDVIVNELETQLQSKLLIEFPVFPFNDDCMKTLGSILG